MDYLSGLVIVFTILAILSLFLPSIIINNNRKNLQSRKVCTQCYSEELVEIDFIINENVTDNIQAYECKKCQNIVIKKKTRIR